MTVWHENVQKGTGSMKFLPLDKALTADAAALEQEYAAAEDFTPAKLGGAHFFFKTGRKVYYIPYGAVTRVFRRVELVNARMGCCNQGIPMESIVICGDGEQELAQIRVGSERMSKALLEALGERCANAEIGYVRSPEQESAVRYV